MDYSAQVPGILKDLAKYIARTFYPIESAVVMSILTQTSQMKEEDLFNLLKLSKKMVRVGLTLLKNDHLIEACPRMEKVRGRMHKFEYYYINYNILVNFTKYKISSIRRSIEAQTKAAASSTASFHCSYCQKSFSDLEVDLLLDQFNPGASLRCYICYTPVEEVEQALKTDSLQLMKTFNIQMDRLYKLVEEAGHIEFNPSILCPSRKDAGSEEQVFVSLSGKAFDEQVPKPKELPVWFQQSTVFKDSDTDIIASKQCQPTENKVATPASSIADTEVDFMSLLMEFETPSVTSIKEKKRKASSRVTVRDISDDLMLSDSDDSDEEVVVRCMEGSKQKNVSQQLPASATVDSNGEPEVTVRSKFAVLRTIVDHLKRVHLEGKGHARTLEQLLCETSQTAVGTDIKEWLENLALVDNPRVKAIAGGYFAFNPVLNINNGEDLLQLFESEIIGGIMLDDIADSLPHHDTVLQTLEKKLRVVVRPDNKKKVVFYVDTSNDTPVDDELKKIWRSTNVHGIVFSSFNHPSEKLVPTVGKEQRQPQTFKRKAVSMKNRAAKTARTF